MDNTSIYVNLGKRVDSDVIDLILEEVWDDLDEAKKEYIVDTLKLHDVDFELYPKSLITLAD